MNRSRWMFGVLLFPWMVIPPRNEESLVFDPAIGSQLHKQVSLEIELRLEQLRFDGQRFSMEDYAPIRLVTSADFTDEYARVGGGRPLELLRRFKAVSGEWEFEGKREDIMGFEALSGGAVRFEWNREKCEYSVRPEETTPSLLSLDALVEDMDLRGLLPGEKVANGATWEARGRSLVDALFGGMEMGLVENSTDRVDLALLRDLLMRPFKELAEKQAILECKYVESTQPGEVRIAEIALRHKDKYKLDITDQLNDFLNSSPGWSGRVSECRLDWPLDGRGSLGWNVTESRYESLDFAAEFELTASIGLQGLGQLQTIELKTRGTSRWTMRAAAGD